MRAISLWQPWASAIALLLKSNETRGWATKYRGPIAIHAARRWTNEQRDFTVEEHKAGRLPLVLPLGAVVAVAWLVDCQPSEAVLPTIGAVEKLYGNYGPGRFAWLLKDVQALKEPLPFIGRQGFFEVPVEHLQPLVGGGWFGRLAA